MFKITIFHEEIRLEKCLYKYEISSTDLQRSTHPILEKFVLVFEVLKKYASYAYWDFGAYLHQIFLLLRFEIILVWW